MNLFVWFAVGLTVVYIIYYAVLIMNDLYGKSQVKKDEVEVFAPPPDAETVVWDDEAPTVVAENDEGFSIGEQVYDAAVIHDDVVEEQPEAVPAPQQEQEDNKVVEPKATLAETLSAQAKETSDAIDIDWTDTYGRQAFNDVLLNEGQGKIGRPKITAKLEIDEI